MTSLIKKSLILPRTDILSYQEQKEKIKNYIMSHRVNLIMMELWLVFWDLSIRSACVNEIWLIGEFVGASRKTWNDFCFLSFFVLLISTRVRKRKLLLSIPSEWKHPVVNPQKVFDMCQNSHKNLFSFLFAEATKRDFLHFSFLISFRRQSIKNFFRPFFIWCRKMKKKT